MTRDHVHDPARRRLLADLNVERYAPLMPPPVRPVPVLRPAVPRLCGDCPGCRTGAGSCVRDAPRPAGRRNTGTGWPA